MAGTWRRCHWGPWKRCRGSSDRTYGIQAGPRWPCLAGATAGATALVASSRDGQVAAISGPGVCDDQEMRPWDECWLPEPLGDARDPALEDLFESVLEGPDESLRRWATWARETSTLRQREPCCGDMRTARTSACDGPSHTVESDRSGAPVPHAESTTSTSRKSPDLTMAISDGRIWRVVLSLLDSVDRLDRSAPRDERGMPATTQERARRPA